ncbi:protein farnesyltransferase subunit beta-like isoform X2 [Tripterygium wilfordii]|uniref:protein farnesyltransferase subunit beta-like isoform X2 n=1 Tax=Tripterygium wilfordii TaxID=458696 RepID=UPI0018F85D36|nr:protein farnesyltransferase subunit beta-like isoform X2 [Tripterygium wilfordii]
MDSSKARRGTASEVEQLMVQDQVFGIYDIFANIHQQAKTLLLEIQRDNHSEFLTKGLRKLSPSFCVLDANRPWLCYWILHSIALLGDSVDDQLENNAVDFLNRCQDSNGGYGGGPGQMPHLATTYAAVNTLVTLGGQKALSSINRCKLYTFLRRMKDPSGAFRMHDAGEIDVRACYTAVSVASLLNILDDELIQNLGNYILSCQTYEGGISGEPGSEAHGGYTFCGLAAMILINEVHCLDLSRLIDWVVFRQGVEGGFQGRTNKLVDGCYSFWQGGVFALLRKYCSIGNNHLVPQDTGGDCSTDSPYSTTGSDISEGEEGLDGISSQTDDTSHFKHEDPENASCSVNPSNISHSYTYIEKHTGIEPLFHSLALQQFLLLCSQDQEGGFRDKPGKHRDYYHTCYCLSGLSVSQHSWNENEHSPPSARVVMGPYSNLLEPIHPLHNVVIYRYHEAKDFFSQ